MLLSLLIGAGIGLVFGLVLTKRSLEEVSSMLIVSSLGAYLANYLSGEGFGPVYMGVSIIPVILGSLVSSLSLYYVYKARRQNKEA